MSTLVRRKPEHSHWLIGEPKWRADDIASITIARTKRAARKQAELALAYAEYSWAKRGKASEALRAQDPKRADWPLDRYAEWAADVGGVSGLVYAEYLTVRDGIWLIGPNGEREHITQATAAARKAVVKAEKADKAMLDAMVQGIVESVKQKGE